MSRSIQCTIVALALVAGAAPAHPSVEPEPERCAVGAPLFDLEPTRIGWSEIEVKATKFLLSTTSVLELGSLPARRADLLKTDEHRAVPPSGPAVGTLRVDTRYLGRETFTTVWFDPTTGRGLQGERYDPGKRRKLYRFTEHGMLTRRRYPDGEAEVRLAPDRWTEVSTAFYPYVPEPSGDAVVTDPGVVFWLLGAAPLDEPGDSILIAVFSEEHLLPVRITVEREETLVARYVRIEDGRETEVARPHDALRVALRPAPDADEDTRRRFQLLGLEGDIDVLVDREDRLPLLVEGRVQVVGHVKVRLQRAVMRASVPREEPKPPDEKVNSGVGETSNQRPR